MLADKYVEADRYKDSYIEAADTEADKQVDRQLGRHKCRLTNVYVDRWVSRLIGRQTVM
jgi:hypothetical protein